MKPVVAIVEDLPETQALFKKYVHNLWPEAKVCQFVEVESALKALASSEFDVVISDVNFGSGLESVGGFKVAQALSGTTTPLIVVSGAPQPDQYRLIFKVMGAWDYMQKPIQESDLHIQLERAMPFRQAQKQRSGSLGKRGETSTPDARLVIDIGGKDQVLWKGIRVTVTMTHVRILQKLLEQPNTIVRYEELFHTVKSGANIQNLRQHIKEMRAAFKEADEGFDNIETTQFAGYSWRI